ncbi:MAG: OPT/YSL family transporter [Sphaerochaetaceae bacterium]|nr:OPT/YSL family transporter [Sphaerochaetaceae bacterium]MDD3163786.1 OPT/YSL family transporter [Sphaerochaetaceae bacterium]MDD4008005.1 OPT/YSL family transporter [Sphaerochaetaceae bacterium]MDD4396922.1 OPT/YSL family transporter [Sphaerochaetaceae bacterium]
METQEKQFTLRSFFVGLFGLVIITASSMYVALKLGALPWPTVFVTVASFGILNLFKKKPTLKEINVTHTFMSAGAMVAGGLAFTVPGFWMAQPDGKFPTLQLLVLTVAGAVLGVLFTSLYRHDLIEKQKLPYPMGEAAYNTLIAGTTRGKSAVWLFAAMIASILFTAARDGLGWIPAVLVLVPATAVTAALTVYVSPMALGIGAMIGPVYSFVWLGGAIAAHFVLVPILIKTGAFADMAGADLFRQGLGIGLMIGTGIGVALKIIITKIAELVHGKGSGLKIDPKKAAGFAAVIAAVMLMISLFTEITFVQSILLVAGIALVTYLSGMLTGQTGVNPMEIFGILVFLIIGAVSKTTFAGAFSIAAVTAVACGLVGDVMNDLKSGSLIGTRAKAQLAAESIGGIIGAVVSVFVLIVLKNAFGFGTGTELPAPQAAAVSAMAGGQVNQTAMLIGVAIGIVLFLLKAPTATLGLGVYLPVYISTVMGLGAALLLIVRKCCSKKKDEINAKAGLIASGLLGGEGITGVVMAIISILSV